MKNRFGFSFFYFLGIVLVVGCNNHIQPTITVTAIPKTLVTYSAIPTSTPISTESAYFKALNPMQIQMPSIESNLLQNSGFENGLSGWKHSDNIADINIFELINLQKG